MWSEACEVSFTKLKDLLTTAPVLAFPDFRKPFILETDASGAGLDAVLVQKQEDGLFGLWPMLASRYYVTKATMESRS